MQTERLFQIVVLVSAVAISGCQSIYKKPMPIAPAMQLDKIRVRNYLSQCLTIKPLGVRHTLENVALLTHMTASQDLSQCQCKSVFVEYQVLEKLSTAGSRVKWSEWGKGYFIAPVPKFQRKPQAITLKSDTALEYKGNLLVSLRCKDP